ncbi:ABC transporter substrate-binding protein [Kribbella capetownensis]|nr:extracellular solute-binding protein [Kribbella capetownensis]
MITRRNFLAAAGLASLSAAGLTACSGGSAGGDAKGAANLEVIWWGADDRAAITNSILAMYGKKYPGNTAKGQFLPFGDYFNKLNTLAASNSLPDIIQLNLPNLAAYVKNGLLLDLGDVDLGDYAKASLETGKIDGKLYGINFGYQYLTVMYNTELVTKSGLAVPKDPADWNAWGDFGVELAKKLGNGVYGMSDNSAESNTWASWLTSRGKGLFSTDGKLAHDEGDAVAWYQYWSGLRDRGAIAPGAESQTYVSNGGAAVDPLTTGKSVISMSPIVQFQGYQKVNKVPLGLAPCPTGPSGRGEVNAFFGWGISSKTKNPQAAKDFLNLWFTDPGAFKELGLDRAIPASKKQLDTVSQGATGAIKTMLGFMDSYTISPASQPASPPSIGSKVQDSLTRAAEAVLAKKLSPEQAGAQYFSEIKAAAGE